MNTQDVGESTTPRSSLQRNTRQRRAVEDQLTASDDFRSAQEIHDALRRGGERAGLATVYRTLQSMVENGEVDVIKNSSAESVYRRCSPEHHHHLVCRSCGRTVEIDGPAVERWATAMAAEHDFADVSHTVELFGTCPDCARAASG